MRRITFVFALALSVLVARGAGTRALQCRRSDDSADAGGDGQGPGDVPAAGRTVPDPHRPLRRPAECGAGDQPSRTAGSRRARSRARAGQAPRAAARHPGRVERQHPHHRHADHRRRAGIRRLRAAVRSDPHAQSESRRRDHHRQDRTDRARQLGGRQPERDAGQLQRGRRLRVQPLRSASRPAARAGRRPAGAADRRLELRHRHGGQPVGRQRRLRYRRLDHQPVECEHAGRHPADHRAHQPLRRDSDHRRSRHRRADDAHRRRFRDHARRHGRRGARSQRCGHADVHAAAESRLHEVPQRRRAQRRAHRRAARVLHRSA